MDDAELGQPDGTQAEGEGSSAAAADQTFTVVVNGVETDVTLDELQRGYMRQKDYTIKTQGLSAERRQLEALQQLNAALQVNPRAAIQALAERYGLLESDSDPEDDTPTNRELRELRERVERQERQRQQEAVDREIRDLRSRFGDDVDVELVMRHAVNGNFPNLKSAYLDLHEDELTGALTKLKSRKSAEEQIVDAKRDASVVSIGEPKGRSAAATKAGPPEKMTLKESFAKALQELGL